LAIPWYGFIIYKGFGGAKNVEYTYKETQQGKVEVCRLSRETGTHKDLWSLFTIQRIQGGIHEPSGTDLFA
jgi:hypothetical protein